MANESVLALVRIVMLIVMLFQMLMMHTARSATMQMRSMMFVCFIGAKLRIFPFPAAVYANYAGVGVSLVARQAECLAHTVGYGLGYDGEIAVAQVEHQFLQRAARLDERMAVGVSAVGLFLEVHILYHIARMTQRELHLVAFHGEEAAQTARHGVEAARVMGGTGGRAEVVYHIARGHDGEVTVHHHRAPEYGLVVVLGRFAVVAARTQHVAPHLALPHDALQLLQGGGVVEECVVLSQRSMTLRHEAQPQMEKMEVKK